MTCLALGNFQQTSSASAYRQRDSTSRSSKAANPRQQPAIGQTSVAGGRGAPNPGTYSSGPHHARRHCVELAGDDEVLLQELVEYVLAETPRLMSQLRHALDQGNSTALAEAAHGLKGTFGQVAAGQARSAAAAVEQLARHQQFDRLESACARLETSLERLEVCLTGWMSLATTSSNADCGPCS